MAHESRCEDGQPQTVGNVVPGGQFVLQTVAAPCHTVAPVDEVIDGPFRVPEEVGSGFFIAPFCHGDGSPSDDGAHHGFHKSVHGIKALFPVQVYLQEMGQDVRTAGGCLEGAHGVGIPGAEEGNFRPQGLRGPSVFLQGLGIRNDGAAVHLRTGGGHGGDGDEGKGPGELDPVLHQVPGVSLIGGAAGDDLGRIDDTAAAGCDDEVDTPFPAEPGALVGQGNFRIWLDSGNFIARKAGFSISLIMVS